MTDIERVAVFQGAQHLSEEEHCLVFRDWAMAVDILEEITALNEF